LLYSEEPITARYSALALGSVSASHEDLEALEEAVERHSDEEYITQTANKAIDRVRRRIAGEDEDTEVDQLLQRLRDSRRYKGQIVEERLEEGGEGDFEEIEMHEEVQEVLRSRGIDKLYTHQAEAIQSLRDGGNVVISTETASGKSMVYTIPALERAIESDLRTLYIGPQNALVNDQCDTLSEIFDDVSSADGGVFGSGLEVEKYTGQLDKESKREVRRKRPSVLLTNPDMIHYSLLPYSDDLWSWLFDSLDLVVVDEVHEYRGVFGSHVALILRRLRRIAERNGSSPQFVCCSATICNPVEHAANVTGEDEETFSLHDTDYSESGDKKWILWNPPRTGGEDNKRRSNHTESVRLFSDLVSSGYQTITFTRTRQGAEEYAMRSENDLRGRNEHKKATSVQAYEGALTQKRRGEIEQGLKTGEIEGVWSTSALELGVDIGGLDSVILDGYPGTLMEAYQRAGRAGRGEDESLVALVASDNPLDQYVVTNSEEFFSKDPEKAVVNPENESIMQDHLRAAADEEPLLSMDERFFGEEMSEIASKTGDISMRDGRYVYSNGSPHYRMNIRSINDVTIEVKTTSGQKIADLDFESALRDVHPGAYYFHQGEKYKVKHLDLDDYAATVRPTSDRHITRVVRRKDIHVNGEIRKRSLCSDLTVKFADLEVSTRFPEYAVVDRKSDTIVKKVELDLPSSQIQTKGLYFSVPSRFLNEVEEAGGEDEALSGLHAAEHALISMFPLEVLCDRRDIGGLSIDLHPHTGEPTIFIHGAHKGGVGICSTAYDSFETIVSHAQSVVESCSCSGGCPSCVYSPHCGSLNEDLSKPKAERLLTVMSQRMN
jgi:DEAD/DEAH box helicase domain-containing protein